MSSRSGSLQGTRDSLYTSLWDFKAMTETELSFQAGDQFQVIEKKGEWWWSQKIDASGGILEEGYVPYNYLARQETMEAETWFFGQISRSETVHRLLSEENKRGAFLIRRSEKNGADYVLSVRDDSLVRHYRILRNTEGNFSMNATRSFPDLLSLVEYYKAKVLTNGLTLSRPCYKASTTVMGRKCDCNAGQPNHTPTSYTRFHKWKWSTTSALPSKIWESTGPQCQVHRRC